MGNGVGRQADRKKRCFRVLSTLSDGIRNLPTLAEAKAHTPLLVPRNHQGTEAESAPSLDHLGGAIYEDNLLNQAIIAPVAILI
jgi:hypothetical protein